MQLDVNVFVGAHNLPLLVAQEQGFFRRQGLSVELVRTSSSGDQLTGLIDGRWPIVHTSPDNLLGWGDRSGADLVAWLGGSVGPLALVAQSSIRSVADLRGRTISVDALDTGFTYALQAMLAHHGLDGGDYALEAIGATNHRWETLRDGRALATLLNPPFSLLARDLGFSVLDTHRTVAPRLATSVAGARRAWLAGNLEVAAAYARAFAAALAWCAAPANAVAAADLLVRQFNVTSKVAAEVLALLLDPATGFLPAGALDLTGLRETIRLRADETGWQPRSLEAYYELQPWLRAMGAEA